jgi:predicted phosphodiesterase
MGRWRCDTPMSLLESALAEMRKIDAAPDHIIIPGDFTGHFVLDLLPDATFGAIISAIRDYFPTTQLIPSLGNNDHQDDYGVSDKSDLEQLRPIFTAANVDLPESFYSGGYYETKSRDGRRYLVINSTPFSPFAASNIQAGI